MCAWRDVGMCTGENLRHVRASEHGCVTGCAAEHVRLPACS